MGGVVQCQHSPALQSSEALPTVWAFQGKGILVWFPFPATLVASVRFAVCLSMHYPLAYRVEPPCLTLFGCAFVSPHALRFQLARFNVWFVCRHVLSVVVCRGICDLSAKTLAEDLLAPSDGMEEVRYTDLLTFRSRHLQPCAWPEGHANTCCYTGCRLMLSGEDLFVGRQCSELPGDS